MTGRSVSSNDGLPAGFVATAPHGGRAKVADDVAVGWVARDLPSILLRDVAKMAQQRARVACVDG